LFLAAAVALAVGVWVGSASSGLAAFTPYASGFESPVCVTSAPGDPTTLYVVEQPGVIKIVRNGAAVGTFLDLRSRIKSGGELGYGLCNPWRFSFDRANGNLWIGDVGQNAWEEVDYRNAARVSRLANYGWSRFEGKSAFDSHKPYVRKGFYGDYCNGTIWSFKAGNGRLSAPTGVGSIKNLSSFGEDGNGELYATSLDGSLYRLR
jgi:hypothetical protein